MEKIKITAEDITKCKNFAITKYREGKISIGRAAEISGLSISEMIDVLAKLGVQNKLELLDYLEASKNVRSI